VFIGTGWVSVYGAVNLKAGCQRAVNESAGGPPNKLKNSFKKIMLGQFLLGRAEKPMTQPNPALWS
jgi:hypothetical protein